MLALLTFELELLWEAIHVLANLGGFAIRAANLRDPSDRRLIDDFLDAHPQAQPFHRPCWIRGVERGTGQDGHYLIAEDSGKTCGILPLSRIRSPLFGNALVSTGFGVGGGIVSSSDKAVEALAQAAATLAEREKCSTIELRGGPIPDGWQREEGLYAGFRRELPFGDEQILASIPRKQRAEVRRTLAAGLDVEAGRSERLVDQHYQVYAQSVHNLGTPVFPRALFEAMLDEWHDAADIIVVRSGDEPVAAVLSLYDSDTVFPYWGGGTQAARPLRANNLLYFALMRHAAERGCRTFDFGRSKVGTGAFAYKSNWGFSPTPLVYARKGRARDVNPLAPKRRLQTAVWKRLPLPIANRLGPLIARGLG
jgi:FemAB-related protein (PEP-CTERM system-associated)